MSETIKYCANCGQQRTGDSRVCSTCGSPFDAKPHSNKRVVVKNKRVIYSLLALILIGAIINLSSSSDIAGAYRSLNAEHEVFVMINQEDEVDMSIREREGWYQQQSYQLEYDQARDRYVVDPSEPVQTVFVYKKSHYTSDEEASNGRKSYVDPEDYALNPDIEVKETRNAYKMVMSHDVEVFLDEQLETLEVLPHDSGGLIVNDELVTKTLK
ncbi:hypothetical protein SAMN05421734_10123 [Pelagirhabdus alkalitolerans]|uniref:Zinc-ribbon domain-containing protein n=1 Tax=Pelagirhabdus alkalitolerans TaxID=1612202 RepID=A0A1G6GG51_9BACI|nr:hypothetical protein [Pelagirhabdus alkalitolerans]SDB80940.1 hypothetical protein SAMN05421734_10123 [Pelagirhabdus alkalitolerans]